MQFLFGFYKANWTRVISKKRGKTFIIIIVKYEAHPKNVLVITFFLIVFLLFLFTCHQVCTVWKTSVFGVFQFRIFPNSDWIQRDTSYLSVFNRNAGKYGPEKLRIRTLFTQWCPRHINSMHFKYYGYYGKRGLGLYLIGNKKRGKVTKLRTYWPSFYQSEIFPFFALTRSFSLIGYLALIQKIQAHTQVVFFL